MSEELIDPETNAVIVQVLTRLATGLCIVCGEQPTRMRQVYRAYYAEPCGHRQGVGSAKAWNAKYAAVSTDRPPEQMGIEDL